MCSFLFGFTPHKYNLKLIFFLIQWIVNIIAFKLFSAKHPMLWFF